MISFYTDVTGHFCAWRWTETVLKRYHQETDEGHHPALAWFLQLTHAPPVHLILVIIFMTRDHRRYSRSGLPNDRNSSKIHNIRKNNKAWWRSIDEVVCLILHIRDQKSIMISLQPWYDRCNSWPMLGSIGDRNYIARHEDDSWPTTNNYMINMVKIFSEYDK